MTEPTEKQILADIDKLRDEFTQTQDLYREVCTLLFFRYGMTPTANKLYQFVRKGSMSAPSEALNKFWEDLREKSRVRIEHPDLPEALKVTAGDLVSTLWSTAQEQAHESLASIKSESQLAVLEAKTALASAEIQLKSIEQTQLKLQSDLAQAQQQNVLLGQELAASKATNAAFETQIRQAKAEHTVMQQRLEDARRDFTAELEKQRQATALAEERCRAMETRSLLDIDRERGTLVKLQKELESAKQTTLSLAERHTREIAALQEQLGDARQKTGMLEGNLQAITSAYEVALKETKHWQAQTAELSNQLSVLRNATENLSPHDDGAQLTMKPPTAQKSKRSVRK